MSSSVQQTVLSGSDDSPTNYTLLPGGSDQPTHRRHDGRMDETPWQPI